MISQWFDTCIALALVEFKRYSRSFKLVFLHLEVVRKFSGYYHTCALCLCHRRLEQKLCRNRLRIVFVVAERTHFTPIDYTFRIRCATTYSLLEYKLHVTVLGSIYVP